MTMKIMEQPPSCGLIPYSKRVTEHRQMIRIKFYYTPQMVKSQTRTCIQQQRKTL